MAVGSRLRKIGRRSRHARRIIKHVRRGRIIRRPHWYTAATAFRGVQHWRRGRVFGEHLTRHKGKGQRTGQQNQQSQQNRQSTQGGTRSTAPAPGVAGRTATTRITTGAQRRSSTRSQTVAASSSARTQTLQTHHGVRFPMGAGFLIRHGRRLGYRLR